MCPLGKAGFFLEIFSEFFVKLFLFHKKKSLPHFEDFPTVTKYHLSSLKAKCQEKNIQLMYLCGEDHAEKCYLFMRGPSFCDGIICISRGEETVVKRAVEKRATPESFQYVVTKMELDVCFFLSNSHLFLFLINSPKRFQALYCVRKSSTIIR